MTRDKLTTRAAELVDALETMQSAARAEDRLLTDEEERDFRASMDELERVQGQLENIDRLATITDELRSSGGRKTQAESQGENERPRVRIEGVRAAVLNDRRRHGFRSLGDFAQAVHRACMPGAGGVDRRLAAFADEERGAATTYGSEGTNADGGYAVPPDFRQSIQQLLESEDSLAARCNIIYTQSKSVTLPYDGGGPWNVSGGVFAGWQAEAAAATQRKPALGQHNVAAHRLAAVVPITDELLEDAPALDSYLNNKVPASMVSVLNDAILTGDDSGKPMGLLDDGHTALISVAKESMQVADTLVFENIVKAWSRCYGPSRGKAVWIHNQNVEPQLFTMAFEGTSSSVPVFLPANGLGGSPFSTLMGRPMIPQQNSPTLGDLGDIILADLSQYLLVMRTDYTMEASVHLFFDAFTTAFRASMRVGGRPWWAAAVTGGDGATTYSPFVAVAARA